MRLRYKTWGEIGLLCFVFFSLVECGDFPFRSETTVERTPIEIPINILSAKTSLDLTGTVLTNVHMKITGCSSGYAPSNFLFNGSTVNFYQNDSGCVLSLCSFTYNGEAYPNPSPPCGTFSTTAGSLTTFTGTGGANPGGDSVYAYVSQQLTSPITVSDTAVFYILENDDFGNTDLPITSTLLTVSNSSPSTAPFTVAASTASVSFLFKLLYPNPPPSTALTVNYAMTGSAVAGADYTAPSGTITIPANSSSATLTVSLINNANARETPLSLGVNFKSSSGFQGVSSYQSYGSPSVMITNTSTTLPTTALVYRGGPTNFVQSGGHVTSWSDGSGSGDGVTFTGSGSPTYNATGLNSLATVGFSGSNFLKLTTNTNVINSNGSGYTGKVISLALVTGSSVTTRQVIYEQGDATSGLNIYIFNGMLYGSTWRASGTDFSVSAYVLPNSAYSVSLVYNSTTLLLQLYISGVLVDQQTIAGAIASSTAGVGIGGNAGTTKFETGTTTTAVTGFTGQIAEYFHYNNPTLTATQIASIHGYLDAKYAMNTFPAVTLTAARPSVGETDANAQGFIISRSIATSSPLTVYYTMSGTAVAGTNYITLPGSVTIPAYSASVYTGIQGIYNSSPQSSYTATMTLANDAGNGTTPITYIGAPNAISLNIVAYAPPISATLVSWLDASSGVTTSGGNVSSWVDKSGNAINGTGTSGHFPTSVTSSTPNYIKFNGTTTSNAQLLSLTSNTLLDSAASYTQKTFAVVFKTGTDITDAQAIYGQGTTTNGIDVALDAGSVFLTVFLNSASPILISQTVTTNTLYDLIFEYDEVHGQLRGYLNGVAMTPLTTGVGTLTGTANSTFLGSITGNADFLQGNFQLYEILLFNGVLSSSDFTALHNYLFSRYSF